jgi:hypothetical protein
MTALSAITPAETILRLLEAAAEVVMIKSLSIG